MRLTIIRTDNLVGIDGVFKPIDLTGLLAEGIHAVQWDETTGEIEPQQPPGPNTIDRLPNTPIDSIEQFQPIISLWESTVFPEPLPITEQRKYMGIGRFQFMAILLQKGLLDDVDAFIATQPFIPRLFWRETGEFARLSPFIELIKKELQLTDEELDAIFTTKPIFQLLE